MWIWSFNNSHTFSQSDFNASVPINRYETMVYWLKALIGSVGQYKNLR